jgi:hypothetical protein
MTESIYNMFCTDLEQFLLKQSLLVLAIPSISDKLESLKKHLKLFKANIKEIRITDYDYIDLINYFIKNSGLLLFFPDINTPVRFSKFIDSCVASQLILFYKSGIKEYLDFLETRNEVEMCFEACLIKQILHDF